MPAYYDTYDYPSYWEGRKYEHESEIIAITSFLKKIPKLTNIVEVGAGYGRLVPTYYFRGKKIILSDPSAKLLKMARDRLKNNKDIKFIHTGVENLYPKIRKNTADLSILIRVLHHLKNPDEAFFVISKITKPGGFLILEFPNKRHLKATISEFFHGNFTFTLDISPKEVKDCKKRKKTIPFYNYHPDVIKEKLKKYGFYIIETRSVSNIRSPLFKRLFPIETLLSFERLLQKPFSFISFGPSIFILAKKVN